jgi:hypothetical protein
MRFTNPIRNDGLVENSQFLEIPAKDVLGIQDCQKYQWRFSCRLVRIHE